MNNQFHQYIRAEIAQILHETGVSSIHECCIRNDAVRKWIDKRAGQFRRNWERQIRLGGNQRTLQETQNELE